MTKFPIYLGYDFNRIPLTMSMN